VSKNDLSDKDPFTSDKDKRLIVDLRSLLLGTAQYDIGINSHSRTAMCFLSTACQNLAGDVQKISDEVLQQIDQDNYRQLSKGDKIVLHLVYERNTNCAPRSETW